MTMQNWMKPNITANSNGSMTASSIIDWPESSRSRRGDGNWVSKVGMES
jgi:hypothetical protein